MDIDDLLIETFDRVRELVPSAVDGLTLDQLTTAPGGSGNTIAWLIWHLSRVQDDHVADAAGTEQVWLTGGWREKFGLDLDGLDTGYGHDQAEVARVQASAELLTAYHEAVAAATESFVRGLNAADLDRVVDTRWTPPVTLGVRLVSVASDTLQHVGQAAYVRGLID
jgi:uncharacterized damage-inducible protein DinB